MRTITGHDLGLQLMVAPEKPDSSRMEPARFDEGRGYMNKPAGGLWTSSVVDGISDWIRWCRGEDWGGVVDGTPWWMLAPEPNTTLLQIDGWDDLDLVMECYGRDLWPGTDLSRRTIDFDAIKKAGFAGVNLTVNGAVTCHYGDWRHGYTLNSWDCESTVWLRWSFTAVTEVSREVLA